MSSSQRGVVITVACVALALALYSFQFSGGWRFDDGHHLAFLSYYSHFEYIYRPEAARLQSGAHYTPFNILTYDLAHRLAPFSKPALFYAFHITLIGLAAAALYAYLNVVAGRVGAIFGAAIFLCGFPVAGMSGQLMVGHYVVGFAFAGLCLYFYERTAQGGFSPLAILFYFLACLSKEIFLPLILFPALDPRFDFRQRVYRVIPWLAAGALFWLLRTLVVASIVGGYNDGLLVNPLAALNDIVGGLYAYATINAGTAVVCLLLAMCCGLTIASLWQRFGGLATMMIAGGAIAGTLLPLMPVALQVSPQVPVEIRLLSGVWFVLSMAAAVALGNVTRWTGVRHARPILASTVALATVWSSVSFVRTAPLFRLGHEFDAVTRYLTGDQGCYLVDKYGWSSWLFDLNRAVQPQTPPPLMARREILNLVGEPGHPICEFDNVGIHAAGKVEVNSGCVADERLSLDFAYNGSHVAMNFGPDHGGIYYLEVPGEYFLKLPANFIMPYPDRTRLEVFRLLRIMDSGAVACSPFLHFDPESHPTLQWEGSRSFQPISRARIGRSAPQGHSLTSTSR